MRTAILFVALASILVPTLAQAMDDEERLYYQRLEERAANDRLHRRREESIAELQRMSDRIDADQRSRIAARKAREAADEPRSYGVIDGSGRYSTIYVQPY